MKPSATSRRPIAKTYAKKGQEVVDKNIAAVDATLENLHQVDTTGKTVNGHAIPPAMSPDAPDYVQNVLGKMMCGEGDSIPVSQMPVDGTFPNGTSQYEKRNLALDLPEWDPTLCIQCGKCTAVCPHAVIRSKFFSPDALANAPEGLNAWMPSIRTGRERNSSSRFPRTTVRAVRSARTSARPRARRTRHTRP